MREQKAEEDVVCSDINERFSMADTACGTLRGEQSIAHGQKSHV